MTRSLHRASGLPSDARDATTPPAHGRGWQRRLPPLALTLLVALIGTLVLSHLVARERTLQAGRLQAIVRLKADNVADWMKERLEDARIVRGSVALQQLAVAVRSGDADPALLARLQVRLRDFQRDQAYVTVQMLDEDASLLASAGREEPVTEELRAAVRRAAGTDRVVTIDIDHEPDVHAATAAIHFDIVVPLAGGGARSAVVVLHLDPAQVLFPRIQHWPYPSATAEVLLLRREGDRVRYINDLRFKPNAALQLSFPVTELTRIAVQTVVDPARRGRLLDGLDYRSERVLGVGLAVPGTEWCLLAKMDRREVMGPVWREAGWFAALAALALTTLLMATNVMRQRASLAYSRALAQRLEEDAQRRNVMFGQSRDGMVVLDQTGRVIEANQAFADLHGYPLEAVPQLCVWDWQAVLTKEEALAQLAQDPLPPRIPETRHRRRDGTTFDVELSYTPIQWSGALQVFCVVRDVSGRKAIQASLQQSEERFEYAMRGSNDGLWDWDISTDRVYYSPRWMSMLGYKAGELPDTLETFARLVDPAQRAAILTHAADVIAGRAPKFECEFKLRHRDGHDVDILSRGFVVRDANGAPLRMVGTHIDITERKRDEERLRAANEGLRRSMAALQRHEEELTLIARLNDLLQACASAEEAYRVIGHTLTEAQVLGDGSLAIATGDGGTVTPVAQWGAGALPPGEFRFEECWALRLGQTHAVTDPARDIACEHPRLDAGRGYVCVPLIVKGEVLGLVTCAFPGDAAAQGGRDARNLVATVSEVLKLSLSNLRLRESLRTQATHDPLTGLFNRGYLDDILPRELQRAERRGSRVCVAMLDLDRFKNFNDTYGHEAGDLLLRDFGHLLSTQLRKTDIPCRYGGEEFAVILIDTALEPACHRLDGIRGACERLQLALHGTALPPVAVSIGIAEYPAHAQDAETLLRAADAALYAAKRRGRNQVQSYRPD
ncbi:MAG: diguanylate cyclase [Gammaproteobacteria bacterium]|nr:diguanylate cyclase [Gammaproteobacteria bacterium]